MKKALIFLLLLTSCRTPEQLINKAQRKDPSIMGMFNDTLRIPYVTYDTIFHNGDTIAIIQRVAYRDTVIQVRQIHAKGKYDYKRERDLLKFQKDSLSHALKMEKQRTKQHSKEIGLEKLKARLDKRKANAYNSVLKTYARQEGKTERSNRLFWVLYSLVVTFFFIALLRSWLKNKYKNDWIEKL